MKTERAPKCKHPHLDKTLRCKTCGSKVDIRAKQNKYGNRRTTVDGITFASGKEALRYQELCVAKSCGMISSFACQTVFRIAVNDVHICDYWSDFDYVKDGERIIEDAKPRSKGFRKTPAYRIFIIKKNLMKAVLGIDVVEV